MGPFSILQRRPAAGRALARSCRPLATRLWWRSLHHSLLRLIAALPREAEEIVLPATASPGDDPDVLESEPRGVFGGYRATGLCYFVVALQPDIRTPKPDCRVQAPSTKPPTMASRPPPGRSFRSSDQLQHRSRNMTVLSPSWLLRDLAACALESPSARGSKGQSQSYGLAFNPKQSQTAPRGRPFLSNGTSPSALVDAQAERMTTTI